MKNVLVTGANGHVGNNLVRLLVEKGYKVRASVRNAKKSELIKPLESVGAEIVEADIMRPETLPAVMKGIDGLFQVAAVYTMFSEDPQKDIIDPSVIGGINVLKAAKEAGVKKVIFTSSCAAIGTHGPEGQPLTENDWNDGALTPYMVAKTQAEKKAWEFAKSSGLNLVAINPSGVIGPGFYRHTPTTNTFEMAIRGKLPAVPPFAFSYVDIRDVCKAHLMAYENEKAAGRYIVSDKCLTMKETITMMKEIDSSIKVPGEIPSLMMSAVPLLDWLGNKVMGMPRQITSEMVEEFLGKYPRVSTAKIERELGWKPIDFKESLRDTIDWIRKVFINKN